MKRETHEGGGEEDYSSENDTAGRINKETRRSFLLLLHLAPSKEIFLLIKIFVYALVGAINREWTMRVLPIICVNDTWAFEI